MTAVPSGTGAALLIIGQPVRRGREDEYLAWDQKITEAASRYPGFRGAEVKPPNDVQADWVIVYKFDSVPNLRNWLNSSTRQSFLDQAADLFDGPGTVQVIAQDNEISDPGNGHGVEPGPRRSGRGISGLAHDDVRG